MKVKSITLVSKIPEVTSGFVGGGWGGVWPSPFNHETRITVGERGVVEIIQHQPQSKNDKWFWEVKYVNGLRNKKWSEIYFEVSNVTFEEESTPAPKEIKEMPKESKVYIKKLVYPIRAIQINEPFTVNSLEGKVTGKAGDYLLEGVGKELYIHDKEIFEKAYKPYNKTK